MLSFDNAAAAALSAAAAAAATAAAAAAAAAVAAAAVTAAAGAAAAAATAADADADASAVPQAVILHCRNGRSRSPLVITVFWAVFRGYDWDFVDAWVRQAFRTQRALTAMQQVSCPL